MYKLLFMISAILRQMERVSVRGQGKPLSSAYYEALTALETLKTELES